MKSKLFAAFLFLGLSLSLFAQRSGGIYQGPAARIVTGNGTPPSGNCAVLGDVGKVYVRKDAQAANASLYACDQTGVGVFAWELGGGGGGSGSGNNTLCVDASGSTNTYTCASPSPTPTTYTGLIVGFIPQLTNTGSAQLNVANLGFKVLKKSDCSTNFAANDLIGGNLYSFQYNSPFLCQAAGGLAGANPGKIDAPTTGASMTFAGTSATLGTSDVVIPGATLAVNVTTSTCNTFTPGQTVHFSFTQDAVGGRTVATCTGWDPFTLNPLANITTNLTFFIDNSGNGRFIGSANTETPSVIRAISERALPATPATGFALVPDGTSHIPRFINQAGTIFQAEKELSAGNIRMAGAANSPDSAAAATDISALWSGGTNCGTTTNALLVNGNCATPGGGGGTAMCSDTFATPGAVSLTVTAGHVNCFTVAGTYTFAAAQALANANVTVLCLTPGVILQRTTGGNDLFDTSASDITIQGCSISGNSVNVGYLIHHTAGDRLTLKDLEFINLGTNGGNGQVNIAVGDSHLFTGLRFPGNTAAEPNFYISASGVITRLRMSDCDFTPAGGSTGFQISTNGSVIVLSTFENLNSLGAGRGFYLNGVGTIQMVEFNNISCQETAANPIECFGVWGGLWSNFSNVSVTDNNNALSAPLVAFNDCHSCSFNNFEIKAQNGATACVSQLDTSLSRFNNIHCSGGGGGNGTLSSMWFSGQGAPGSDNSNNTYSNITLEMPTTGAIIGMQFNVGAGASDNINNNDVHDVRIVGNSVSGSVGIKFNEGSTASMAGNHIHGNTFINLDSGIVLAGSPTHTFIDNNTFNTVTTRLTATASSIDSTDVPVPFGNLTACASGLEGYKASVTDANSATFNATFTGSSTNHIIGYCNGTNWTVH